LKIVEVSARKPTELDSLYFDGQDYTSKGPAMGNS